MSTSGGLSPSWDRRTYQKSSIWAFLPYEALRVPTEVGNRGHHPIDAFLQQKREANGLAPAPPAKPRELIRRMFLDLTGLLPQHEELGQWMQRWELAASPEQVIERLIEHLLASPHYGERWAQHWLDVVRYADTGGMSNDYERSNAWRYRDYVVRAFNEDKPYDQFLIEQLAGDELADQSLASRLGEDPSKLHAAKLAGNYSPQEIQWLIASNFLRMGPWDNAMVQEAQARQIYLDDVVNATGQVFLGMTLRCVKCHDHKFDPIPTRDYYRLYAAFATTHLAERPAPFIDAENKQGFEADKAHVEAMLAYAQKEKERLIEKRESAARDWYASQGTPYLSLEKRRNLPDASKPPRGVGLNHTDKDNSRFGSRMNGSGHVAWSATNPWSNRSSRHLMCDWHGTPPESCVYLFPSGKNLSNPITFYWEAIWIRKEKSSNQACSALSDCRSFMVQETNPISSMQPSEGGVWHWLDGWQTRTIHWWLGRWSTASGNIILANLSLAIPTTWEPADRNPPTRHCWIGWQTNGCKKDGASNNCIAGS